MMIGFMPKFRCACFCGAVSIALIGLWLIFDARRSHNDSGQLMVSISNVKALSQAIGEYYKQHGRLPPQATRGSDGTPLLSWRVLILPYLGHDSLYKEFRLDEPWDSDFNKSLMSHMPKVYRHPKAPESDSAFLTHYQVFTGADTPLDERIPIKALEGSTSPFPAFPYPVLLVAESLIPAPWSSPRDIEYDPNRPLPAIGCLFRNSVCAGYLSGGGGVLSLANESELRYLITVPEGDRQRKVVGENHK